MKRTVFLVHLSILILHLHRPFTLSVHTSVILESFELNRNDSQNSFSRPVGKQVRLRRELEPLVVRNQNLTMR